MTPTRQPVTSRPERISQVTAPSRRASWLLLGLVLLSANLRPAAVSVGPVLAEVRDGLGMSTPGRGLLTSLPVLAFAALRRARARPPPACSACTG